jgi:signal peptidase I
VGLRLKASMPLYSVDMKAIFNILFLVLTALFVLVAVFLLVTTFKPAFFPLDARSVLTGSMEPAIPTGSVVFVYPQESYGVGDIVTFKPNGSEETISITHRIIEETNGASGTIFTTKGDANELKDADLLYERDIYGEVVFHIPYLGRLLDVAKTPWGFAALVIIPAALVIADEVKKILAVVRKQKEEEELKKEKE